MNPEKTNNVINFGRKDPESLARATGVLSEAEPKESAPLPPERRITSGKLLTGVGVVGLAAWALMPRADQAPAPQPETFETQVQESAQVPYDPATDELVVGNIRVKPANAAKNTASEAVLSHPDVQAYTDVHPEESSAVTTSAMSLPSSESGTYAVVERDVDADGDTDAVAVPTK